MKKISDNLSGVIKLLSDGEFHDGTSMGEQFDITRAGVWKLIKKLQSYGIAIESVKGKGYALVDELVLLDKRKIKRLMHAQSVSIDLFEQINSTNGYLKDFCYGEKIRVCLAESQTQGRGRFARTWHSPFGQNLYLSLLYPFNKDMSALAGLSLLTGLAICQAIEKLYQLPKPVGIKWPNDLLCAQQKLAGNLIEVQAEAHGQCYAIIGMGINVNMLNVSKRDITQPWTSIRQLTNSYQDRNVLAAALIDQLITSIKRFASDGLEVFLEQWQARDCLRGQSIRLQVGNQVLQGKAMGINSQGHLLLKLKNGELRAFSTGEATLVRNKN